MYEACIRIMLQNRDGEGRNLGPANRDKPNHTAATEYIHNTTVSQKHTKKRTRSTEVEVPGLASGGLGRSMSSLLAVSKLPSTEERAESGPLAWATGDALGPDRPRQAQALGPQ